MTSIELICFDMAGTTMIDNGLVVEAFERTIDGLGLDDAQSDDARAYVLATMGQSKIDVFRALFAERADDANVAFERHFVDAAQELGVVEPYVRAVLAAMWEDGLKMDDPAVISQVLSVAGLDAGAIFAASQTQPIKDRLAANTQTAVDRGAFGIPTFFVGDEIFFGKERLGQVEELVSA